MSFSLENKSDIMSKTVNFYNQNKIKIYTLAFTLILILISSMFIKYNENKKNILVAEKYVKAGLHLASNKPDKAVKLYKEIIHSENKFYSILALNTIIEKNLVSDINIILEYFNILENTITKDNQEDLIIFKKALYLIKHSDNQKGKNLLEKLINKNSILKPISQELLRK
jgi:hypothetical protein